MGPPNNHIHFVIGAMKCGTTSLHASLNSHSQICVPLIKEPGFFSRDTVFRFGVDWYRRQWPEWNSEVHTVALDSTTAHTKAPRVLHPPERIHAFNPTAKLIYLVRDPFERIRSQYMMSLAKNWALMPLEQGVDPFVIDVSRYYYQLQRYRKYFAKEAILVIDLADLISAPTRNLSRICEHLGISGASELSMKKRHVSADHYAMGAGATRYTLDVKNRNQIWRELAADMKSFQQEYGINVSRWGF